MPTNKPTHTPVPHYTLRGNKSVESRWIEIRHEGGEDMDLRHLNLYCAAPDILQALKDLRLASTEAYKSGRIDALAFVAAGNVIAKAEGR